MKALQSKLAHSASSFYWEPMLAQMEKTQFGMATRFAFRRNEDILPYFENTAGSRFYHI
jgi:hypothetical protein